MQVEYSENLKKNLVSTTNAFPVRKTIPGFITTAYKKVALYGENCLCCAKSSFKTFSIKFISAAVATCSLLSLFHFFTFATGVYTDSEIIGITHNTKDYLSAISMADNIAKKSGIAFSRNNIKFYPVFTLRKNVTSPETLKEKLLLTDKNFVSACKFYCDGNLIFTASDEKAAKDAVKGYISSLSMKGGGDIDAPVSYKTEVVPKADVIEKDECIRLLSENKDINVVSIVNSTVSEVIPFETITENDSNLYIGDSVTVVTGKEGSLLISHETTYENGAEKSDRITSQKIALQPVTQVVRIGTKQKNVLQSGLTYPLKGTLSSPFGSRWGTVHEGIDLAVPEGTPVKAAECGTVAYVSENAGGYGKFIRIDHGYGIETAYAHLSRINVSVGQSVSKNTVIALSGNTGRSTGPHLHFEILQSGNPIDPLKYLND